MVLDKLGSSLKNSMQKIAKAIFVDEKLVNELVKDIQRALLQADVNVKLVFSLTEGIKKRILKEDTPAGISKKEYLVKVVFEELVKFLGKEGHKIDVSKKPFKIMLVGLFGSGKTTHAGKLGRFFTTRGHKVCLVGLDVHRPAAMHQIEQVAKGAKVPVFIEKGEKDPLKIWNKHKTEIEKHDVVIVDTAGRDALSDDLVEELKEINKEIKPNENLLVISGDIGQAAQTQAQKFHDSCGVTGVIVSKMDGTAKGGGALSACAITDAPIKFLGVGEKVGDLETFNPEGFVGRLLGMGDIQALLEKAEVAISKEDAEDLGKKFLKGEFNLIDLYEQMRAMKKMGPLNKIMEMVPGFSSMQLPKEMLQVQEGKLEKWKIAMDSMTKQELEDPDLVTTGRIDRVTKGAGVTTKDVRELLKQYRQGKKMMRMMKGKNMDKMMKRMGSMKGMPGMGKMKYK